MHAFSRYSGSSSFEVADKGKIIIGMRGCPNSVFVPWVCCRGGEVSFEVSFEGEKGCEVSFEVSFEGKKGRAVSFEVSFEWKRRVK